MTTAAEISLHANREAPDLLYDLLSNFLYGQKKEKSMELSSIF